MLPNPVYGTGMGAGWDESFPTDKRWSDTPPAQEENGSRCPGTAAWRRARRRSCATAIT
ncbi:hypothetical protein AB5I41_03210 [Sphingomonas sp. MMS24-JH45]